MSGLHPDTRDAILEVFASVKRRPLALRGIANRLGWPRDSYPDLADALAQMVAAGVLMQVRGGRYAPMGDRDSITGTFLLTARGFGFLRPDNPDGSPSNVREGDYFVPINNTGGAMPNDRVRAVIVPERRDARSDRRRPGGRASKGQERRDDHKPRVEIVEVLERARDRFVGTVRRVGGMEILDTPGLPRGQEPILEGGKRLKEGQRVIAKMRQPPEGGRAARMEVASIIGHETDPSTDVETLIEEFRLRHEYPAAGIAQAEAGRAPAEGAPCPPGREDLRDLWCCTIDPATAKDHDDAISIEPAPKGKGWIIGVHIADVGHYVTPGSPCDAEAKERGNSVYLLSRVVHMLPEALAADVCSLRPDVDRYALSCFLEVGTGADVTGWRVAKTLIRSKRRFAYEDVQALFDAEREGATPDREPPALPEDQKLKLLKLRELSAKMAKARIKLGSIDLDLPEVSVLLDENDAPTGTGLRPRLAAHKLVEECMLAANRAIARYLLAAKLPYLCRAHPDPDDAKLERLASLCGLMGYTFPEPHDRFALQAVADQTRKRKHGEVMGNAVLRTLEKARYMAAEQGHFALGWDHYTHFTSPIRRYADTRCHQILTAHLEGRLRTPDERAVLADDLAEACGLASVREVQAEECERELKKLKLLRLLEPELGNTVTGRISAIIERGMFVELVGHHVEGMLRVEDLPGDFYERSDDGFMLVGKKTGKQYRVGGAVDVVVHHIDITRRQLDLLLPDA